MTKVLIKCNVISFLIVLSVCIIEICETASVRTFKPDVFIVTPEPSLSEARNYPAFLPTPFPKNVAHVRSKINNSAVRSKTRVSKENTPDIIIAEFREGSKNEKMLSVKEMLSKEKVTMPKTTTEKSFTTSYVKNKSGMKLEDVWDIIKHNQDLQQTTPGVIHTKTTTTPLSTTEKELKYKMRNDYEERLQVSPPKGYPQTDRYSENVKYAVETIPSISMEHEWTHATPAPQQIQPQLSIDSKNAAENGSTNETPRDIRGNEHWDRQVGSRKPSRINYYPAYSSGYNSPYTNVDAVKYDPYPPTGVAEDRYNPAVYLPPRPDSSMASIPRPKATMPPPPVPMPPPPPPPKPQSVINPPALTYDSIPSYPDSKPPDSSGPPDSYDYKPPSDGNYPPPSFSSPDDNSHNHDDSYKFNLPPSDNPKAPDSDSYPQLIFDDHHHHSHDVDYHDYHDFHPHYHPTTTTTTEAPKKEVERVNNRFSYYYLGKKLWYLPLYFSVYFIIYVGALIIKSIARHKITYPQHYKTKRSIDWNISNENLHYLTRITSNALHKAGEKYLSVKS